MGIQVAAQTPPKQGATLKTSEPPADAINFSSVAA
jgi:hypothetical protein